MRLLHAARRFIVSKNPNIGLQRCMYRTESAVFGFCPQTKEALNASSDAAESLKKNMTSASADSLPVRCLVNAYREHGHLVAAINPLGETTKDSSAEWFLDPAVFNLKPSDGVTDKLPADSTLLSNVSDVNELKTKLHNLYCDNMTIEVSHMLDLAEQEWFCNEYERITQLPLDNKSRIDAAVLMKQAEVLENFLASKFVTTKRYGGEGCYAMMAFLNQLFSESAKSGVDQVVMAMPHRGRVNLLTSSLLNLPPVQMFQKIKGMREFPDDVTGCGDVTSHLSNNTTVTYPDGSVYVTMIPNPSHLEAGDPVAMGKTRAKQRLHDDGDYNHNANSQRSHKVMCLQIHGDAAFAGQGVIQETLGMSGVPHYNVGGSVHLIVNNQLGFTTESDRGRTSRYSSCVGKINELPVIRVNGENPDAVMKAAMVALSYRNTWQKDVIIDMLCYRRYGHNELDNPSFTQPVMYQIIDNLKPLPEEYANQLVEEGVCTPDDITNPEKEYRGFIQQHYDMMDTEPAKANHLEKQWSGLVQAGAILTNWDTGVNSDLLRFIAAKSVTIPDDFNAHPTLLKTHIERRLEKVGDNSPVDWATAESLAFGSLITQGFDVRISGQDVGRGTFSHRHCMLVDQQTDAIYIPLNHLYEGQKNYLELCNSILSEEAVLGYEYGFSIESPKCLPIWEAQFGDFFNGAQIMIDTYIASGEAKWLRQSGLVMLLPTGMDGAGPEHSSCRLERFLQLTDSKEVGIDGDNVNMFVAHPTTPAQYFHLLRRQMVRNFRKPLIMAAPKVLLRLAAATSSISEMGEGTSFQPTLDDKSIDKSKVTKVIFCSGKHYYTLLSERQERAITDTALVRVEELCPFPAHSLQNILSTYPSAKDYMWAQEEHRNSGCWSFVEPRFENTVGVKLRYAGRGELATPATGVGLIHKAECKQILDDAFS